MKLGVSVKIFLAYAVLLSAFAATSIFTFVYLHRAREQVVANQYFLEIQLSVDGAWRNVSGFSPPRTPRNDPKDSLTFVVARQELASALATIDQYLVRETGSVWRVEFESYRGRVKALDARAIAVQAALGVFVAGAGSAASQSFLSDLANLQSGLERARISLRKMGRQIAAQLAAEEEWAVDAALVLGVAGLLAALGAAYFVFCTLRPLGVLRQRARQIAGGEYGQRIGVTSRDEIGDLAREFDGMAGAIQEREQRLIRSEQLATVGRMAAQITHEVRNPLASIALYVDLLGDELTEGQGEGRRLVASLAKEVDRLSEITETYLRFVRLPKPKLEHEDLGAIATSVMEFARAELANAAIVLELRVAPGLPEIAADESQLRQVLLNLTRNAREAMGAGGKLAITVAAGSHGVCLTVADTGPGIAPEHATKIFDPFFSTKAKGTGLGLALVQQIVGEHGGRIELSSPPGGGCVFAITLPALPPRQPLAASGQAGTPSLSSATLPT